MYKLLLVLASAQALKRPQRALAVRGGEVDPITIGKGIVAASGIYGAFDPAANAGLYGIKAEDKGNAMMRLMGWSQILFAAALNLDPETAARPNVLPTAAADGMFLTFYRSVHGQMAYHSSAFLLEAQPSFEKFQPKAPTPSGWRSGGCWLQDLDGLSTSSRAIYLRTARSSLAPQSGSTLRDEGQTGWIAMTSGRPDLCVGTTRGLHGRCRRAFAPSAQVRGQVRLRMR